MSLSSLLAVDGGQHQVEHDQVGRNLPRRLEGLLATGDARHAVAVLRQVVPHQLQQVLLVIDDENMLRGGRFVGRLHPGGRLFHGAP
jgi:hypothetical protein